MASGLGKKQKMNAMKELLKKLHEGMSVEEAKEKFIKEIGNVTSIEIAEIEQSLIEEGVSPEEIKKFCNVHALLFESSLKQSLKDVDITYHPVNLFKRENREIEKLLARIKEASETEDVEKLRQKLQLLLDQLRSIEIHYTRKEQLLFPFLERYGFFGPSKVMWGKDNEIRDLLKRAISELEEVRTDEDRKKYVNEVLNPLIEEVDGMIFKEENILFPTSLEKLSVDDWTEILKQSEEVGYCFIEKPSNIDQIIRELKQVVIEEAVIDRENDVVKFPTGDIGPSTLMYILNTLPVDITFVDHEDTVRYFSEGKSRIFLRTRSIIGRKVQNCHPPQSVDIVEKILESFKNGTRDSADFWINFNGRFIYIRYFAVRDRNGKYLGTIEVTQDITEIKKLEGEKRLLDEKT